MRTGRGSRLIFASTSKRAPSTSGDLGTRHLRPYREARTGSNGSSMTTMVGTPPACRLRTAPRPTTSQLRTTAHGLHAASSMSHAAVPVQVGDVACERAGHVPRSHHEATQGAEAAGSRRAEKVEARHGRFEPDIQLGIPITGAQAGKQGRRQERVPSGVDAITRGEDQVIHESFGAVAESQAELPAGGNRRRNGTARSDRYRSQPRRQPAGTGRSHGTRREEILQRPWRPAKQPRPRDQPAHEAWAHDIKRGTDDGAEQSARRTDERSLRPVRDEVGAGGPGHDFDFRATLVEQGCRFQRALPAAYHHDPLTGEPTQIGVVEGMRNQRCRQSGKLRRAPGEWTDAGGHHHAPRVELFPIPQTHLEPARVRGDVGDRAPIYVRYRLPLEPLPVPYEVFERRGLGVRDAVERVIAIESQLAIGIGDVRSARTGTQQHAARHVPCPKLHRLTEDPSFDVPGAEVRGRRQSVRPRPDDRDMTRRPAVRHRASVFPNSQPRPMEATLMPSCEEAERPGHSDRCCGEVAAWRATSASVTPTPPAPDTARTPDPM